MHINGYMHSLPLQDKCPIQRSCIGPIFNQSIPFCTRSRAGQRRRVGSKGRKQKEKEVTTKRKPNQPDQNSCSVIVIILGHDLFSRWWWCEVCVVFSPFLFPIPCLTRPHVCSTSKLPYCFAVENGYI